MTHRAFAVTVLLVGCAAGAALAQAPDPRTAPGQLAICGGAENWRKIGFLEFEVRVTSGETEQGPWVYRWDRNYGFFRITGKGPDGQAIDVALDLGSRTGGGWKAGKQLMGQELSATVSWALQRFSEDVLWLTFPLEWGAQGVTVKPRPNVTDEAGVAHPAVQVESRLGMWETWLDPASGRVARTIFDRAGGGRFTATWEDWAASAGVFFARKLVIAETGEVVTVKVARALETAPRDAF